MFDSSIALTRANGIAKHLSANLSDRRYVRLRHHDLNDHRFRMLCEAMLDSQCSSMSLQPESVFPQQLAVSASSLKLLEKLPDLTRLVLKNRRAKSVALRKSLMGQVAKMKKLKYLDLSNTGIRGSELEMISNMTSLERINLGLNELVGRDLISLRFLPRLTHVSLRGARVSREGMSYLSKIPALKSLDLSYSRIDARSLSGLADCKNLEHMDLSGVPMTDADLNHLTGLQKISSIALESSPVDGITDAGLHHLSTLGEIKQLSVFRASFLTDAGVCKFLDSVSVRELILKDCNGIGDHVCECISSKESLLNIDLTGASVTDKGVMHLAKNSQIRGLNLSGTLITDQSMEQIGALDSLEGLAVSNTSISGNGIQKIARLKKLRTLDISGTDVGLAANSPLPRIASVRQLVLARCKVGHNDFKTLATMNQLEFLDIHGTDIDDDDCKLLADCQNLRTLFMLDCPEVSHSGLNALCKSRSLSHVSTGSQYLSHPSKERWNDLIAQVRDRVWIE